MPEKLQYRKLASLHFDNMLDNGAFLSYNSYSIMSAFEPVRLEGSEMQAESIQSVIFSHSSQWFLCVAHSSVGINFDGINLVTVYEVTSHKESDSPPNVSAVIE